MANLKLPNRPQIKRDVLEKLIKKAGVNLLEYPALLIGIRGYFLNTMGKAGVNDRNIYDDAIILLTPNVYATFNANTDPSAFRKAIAVLKPGFYPSSWKFDTHGGVKSKYPAICQRLAPMTVIRDQVGEDTGMFGINNHKGGWTNTSSLGCQTIPPSQWDAYYALVKSEWVRMYDKQWNKVAVPYLLLDNSKGALGI
jgi:lysozyme